MCFSIAQFCHCKRFSNIGASRININIWNTVCLWQINYNLVPQMFYVLYSLLRRDKVTSNMQQLRTWTFFGTTDETVPFDFCTITNTEYTLDKVDWHYHENAYFTFILKGKLLECNKNETYHCTAGSLLFHNCQNTHYNIKPPGDTRGFHVEIKKD